MKTISNEQAAAEAEQRIQELKVACVKSLKVFHNAKSGGAPTADQVPLFEDWCEKFDALANFVESCITKSELLGATRSEFWAKELANTATNLLDSIPDFYEKAWFEAERLKQTPIKPSLNAFTAMQNSVVIYNPDQVDNLKERFEKLNLPVRGFTHPVKMNTMYERWEKITMTAAILGFMAALLAVGIWKNDFNPAGFFIIRVVLGIFTAALAAIAVPGFLEVNFHVKKSVAIRATGAIGVFVIIYLVNPPELLTSKTKPTKSEPAVVTK